MNKEMLAIVETIALEKGVSKAVILDAIEQALATATKRRYTPADAEFQVKIDPVTCDYDTFRIWRVRDPESEEEMQNPDAELELEAAREIDENLSPGDVHSVQVESIEFGRIAAQAAKQVIVQKVREAERQRVVEQYESRVGELVSGTVKRTTRDGIIIDLGGNAEAFIARNQLIPRETLRINDRVRALLERIEEDPRGPRLILTRVTPEMLRELFRIEVPEIAEGVIQIRGVARDPGSRAKMSVSTNDSRIDPVGACVGMRGSRVQAVAGELAGERIDVVPWEESPAQLVINALAPADVDSIVVDEQAHGMDIVVAEHNQAQAIGKGGQNVRLASELTGWKLSIMTEEQFEQKSSEEAERNAQVFMESLSVDQDVAEVLVEEGFTRLEEVAYVPLEELAGVPGFDKEIATELQSRAQDAVLANEVAGEGGLRVPAEDLTSLEGMDEELAWKLASQGVITREDLAEQAVIDLLDLVDIGEERAASLIMSAREHWFRDAPDSSPAPSASLDGK